MRRSRHRHGPLDYVDAQIVHILVDDGRVTTAEIARRIGLSAPSVGERIRRLEEAEVIEAYTAVINPRGLGLQLSAYLRIQPVPGMLAKVLEVVTGMPQVVRCDRVTGEDCLVARAHVESVADLERIDDALAPYANVNTSIIQSTPVPYRAPAFPVKE